MPLVVVPVELEKPEDVGVELFPVSTDTDEPEASLCVLATFEIEEDELAKVTKLEGVTAVGVLAPGCEVMLVRGVPDGLSDDVSFPGLALDCDG